MGVPSRWKIQGMIVPVSFCNWSGERALRLQHLPQLW
jgi:hypothetical protein